MPDGIGADDRAPQTWSEDVDERIPSSALTAVNSGPPSLAGAQPLTLRSPDELLQIGRAVADKVARDDENACYSFLVGMRDALFPAGVTSAGDRARTDDDLGVGRTRWQFGEPADWSPVVSLTAVRDRVAAAGFGATAFVLLRRPGRAGHALLARSFGDVGGIDDVQWIDLSSGTDGRGHLGRPRQWRATSEALPADALTLIVAATGRVVRPESTVEQHDRPGSALLDRPGPGFAGGGMEVEYPVVLDFGSAPAARNAVLATAADGHLTVIVETRSYRKGPDGKLHWFDEDVWEAMAATSDDGRPDPEEFATTGRKVKILEFVTDVMAVHPGYESGRADPQDVLAAIASFEVALSEHAPRLPVPLSELLTADGGFELRELGRQATVRSAEPDDWAGVLVHYSVGVPILGLDRFLRHVHENTWLNGQGGHRTRDQLGDAVAFGEQWAQEFTLSTVDPVSGRIVSGYLALLYTNASALPLGLVHQGLVKRHVAALSRQDFSTVRAGLPYPVQAFLREHATAIWESLVDRFLARFPEYEQKYHRVIGAEAAAELQGYPLRDIIGMHLTWDSWAEGDQLRGTVIDYVMDALTSDLGVQMSQHALGGSTRLARLDSADHRLPVPLVVVEVRYYGEHRSDVTRARAHYQRLVDLVSALFKEARSVTLPPAGPPAPPTSDLELAGIQKSLQLSHLKRDTLRDFLVDVSDGRARGANGLQSLFSVQDRALGLGQQAFGVELEVMFPPSWPNEMQLAGIRRLAAMLHAADVLDTPVTGYHADQQASLHDRFRLEVDHSQQYKVELVTPKLTDSRTSWERLRTAMRIIGESGAAATHQTSGHVHVDGAVLGTSVEKYTRLLRLAERLEDALFRLAGDPDRGIHRGQLYSEVNREPSDGYSTEYVTSLTRRPLQRVVNLSYVDLSTDSPQNNHVEFRLWDSVGLPHRMWVVQTHVAISLALVAVAAGGTTALDASLARRPSPMARIGSGSGVFGGDRRPMTAVAELDQARYLVEFLDAVPQREIRERIAKLWAVTRWQSPEQTRTLHTGRTGPLPLAGSALVRLPGRDDVWHALSTSLLAVERFSLNRLNLHAGEAALVAVTAGDRIVLTTTTGEQRYADATDFEDFRNWARSMPHPPTVFLLTTANPQQRRPTTSGAVIAELVGDYAQIRTLQPQGRKPFSWQLDRQGRPMALNLSQDRSGTDDFGPRVPTRAPMSRQHDLYARVRAELSRLSDGQHQNASDAEIEAVQAAHTDTRRLDVPTAAVIIGTVLLTGQRPGTRGGYIGFEAETRSGYLQFPEEMVHPCGTVLARHEHLSLVVDRFKSLSIIEIVSSRAVSLPGETGLNRTDIEVTFRAVVQRLTSITTPTALGAIFPSAEGFHFPDPRLSQVTYLPHRKAQEKVYVHHSVDVPVSGLLTLLRAVRSMIDPARINSTIHDADPTSIAWAVAFHDQGIVFADTMVSGLVRGWDPPGLKPTQIDALTAQDAEVAALRGFAALLYAHVAAAALTRTIEKKVPKKRVLAVSRTQFATLRAHLPAGVRNFLEANSEAVVAQWQDRITADVPLMSAYRDLQPGRNLLGLDLRFEPGEPFTVRDYLMTALEETPERTVNQGEAMDVGTTFATMNSESGLPAAVLELRWLGAHRATPDELQEQSTRLAELTERIWADARRRQREAPSRSGAAPEPTAAAERPAGVAHEDDANTIVEQIVAVTDRVEIDRMRGSLAHEGLDEALTAARGLYPRGFSPRLTLDGSPWETAGLVHTAYAMHTYGVDVARTIASRFADAQTGVPGIRGGSPQTGSVPPAGTVSAVLLGSWQWTVDIGTETFLQPTARAQLARVAQLVGDQWLLTGQRMHVRVIGRGRGRWFASESTPTKAQPRADLVVVGLREAFGNWMTSSVSIETDVEPGTLNSPTNHHVTIHVRPAVPGSKSPEPTRAQAMLRAIAGEVHPSTDVHPVVGPDLFGHRAAPAPPPRLRGHQLSRVAAGSLHHLFEKLNLNAARPPDRDDVERLVRNASWQPETVLIRSSEPSQPWVLNPWILPHDLRQLPKILEMPKLIHSIWLGGVLKRTDPLLPNLANFAKVGKVGHWRAVLWTDVPRAAFEAGRDRDVDGDDYLGAVRDLAAFAEDHRIILMNVDEVFHAGEPGLLDHLVRAERARLTGAGYATASDILRLQILDRFGGLYTDGDNTLNSLNGLTELFKRHGWALRASNQGINWDVSNSAILAARAHPVLRTVLLGIEKQYGLTQNTLMADFDTDTTRTKNYQAFMRDRRSRVLRQSVVMRTGPRMLWPVLALIGSVTEPDHFGIPSLTQFSSSGNVSWTHQPEVPAQVVKEPLSVPQVLSRAVATLVRGLYNREGDLHLTEVAPLIDRLPVPDRSAAWIAVLGFVRLHPLLAPMVRRVTLRRIEPSPPEADFVVRLPSEAWGLLGIDDPATIPSALERNWVRTEHWTAIDRSRFWHPGADTWVSMGEPGSSAEAVAHDADLVAVPGRPDVVVLDSTSAPESAWVRATAAAVRMPVNVVGVVLHANDGWPALGGRRVDPAEWVDRVGAGLSRRSDPLDAVVLLGCTLATAPASSAHDLPVARMLAERLSGTRPHAVPVVAAEDDVLVEVRTGRITTGQLIVDEQGRIRPVRSDAPGFWVHVGAQDPVKLTEFLTTGAAPAPLRELVEGGATGPETADERVDGIVNRRDPADIARMRWSLPEGGGDKVLLAARDWYPQGFAPPLVLDGSPWETAGLVHVAFAAQTYGAQVARDVARRFVTQPLLGVRVRGGAGPLTTQPSSTSLLGRWQQTVRVTSAATLSPAGRQQLIRTARLIADQHLLTGQDPQIRVLLPRRRQRPVPGTNPAPRPGTTVVEELRTQLITALGHQVTERFQFDLVNEQSSADAQTVVIEVEPMPSGAVGEPVAGPSTATTVHPGPEGQTVRLLTDLALRAGAPPVGEQAHPVLGPDVFGVLRSAPTSPVLSGLSAADVPTAQLQSLLEHLDLTGEDHRDQPFRPASRPDSLFSVQKGQDRQWAARPEQLPEHLRELPATMEMPKLFHAIWLGGAVDPTDPFLENVAEFARAGAPQHWRTVLWTDITRQDVVASRDARTGPSKAYLGAVAEMVAFAHQHRILLVSVDEVFHAQEPGPLDRFARSERAKLVGAGYAAASDILRLQILDRFGGVYSDGDNQLLGLEGLDQLFESMGYALWTRHEHSWQIGNNAILAARGHPLMKQALQRINDRYSLPQNELMQEVNPAVPSRLANYHAFLPDQRRQAHRQSVMMRTGPISLASVISDIHPLNGRRSEGELSLGVPALTQIDGIGQSSWLHMPTNPVRMSRPDLPLIEVLVRVLATLIRDLHNRDGDLHLTEVAPVIDRLPAAERPAAWLAVVGFLRLHPELSALVRRVTLRRLEGPQAADDFVVDLPDAARKLMGAELTTAEGHRFPGNWTRTEHWIPLQDPVFWHPDAPARTLLPPPPNLSLDAFAGWRRMHATDLGEGKDDGTLEIASKGPEQNPTEETFRHVATGPSTGLPKANFGDVSAAADKGGHTWRSVRSLADATSLGGVVFAALAGNLTEDACFAFVTTARDLLFPNGISAGKTTDDQRIGTGHARYEFASADRWPRARTLLDVQQYLAGDEDGVATFVLVQRPGAIGHALIALKLAPAGPKARIVWLDLRTDRPVGLPAELRISDGRPPTLAAPEIQYLVVDRDGRVVPQEAGRIARSVVDLLDSPARGYAGSGVEAELGWPLLLEGDITEVSYDDDDMSVMLPEPGTSLTGFPAAVLVWGPQRAFTVLVESRLVYTGPDGMYFRDREAARAAGGEGRWVNIAIPEFVTGVLAAAVGEPDRFPSTAVLTAMTDFEHRLKLLASDSGPVPLTDLFPKNAGHAFTDLGSKVRLGPAVVDDRESGLLSNFHYTVGVPLSGLSSLLEHALGRVFIKPSRAGRVSPTMVGTNVADGITVANVVAARFAQAADLSMGHYEVTILRGYLGLLYTNAAGLAQSEITYVGLVKSLVAVLSRQDFPVLVEALPVAVQRFLSSDADRVWRDFEEAIYRSSPDYEELARSWADAFDVPFTGVGGLPVDLMVRRGEEDYFDDATTMRDYVMAGLIPGYEPTVGQEVFGAMTALDDLDRSASHGLPMVVVELRAHGSAQDTAETAQRLHTELIELIGRLTAADPALRPELESAPVNSKRAGSPLDRPDRHHLSIRAVAHEWLHQSDWVDSAAYYGRHRAELATPSSRMVLQGVAATDPDRDRADVLLALLDGDVPTGYTYLTATDPRDRLQVLADMTVAPDRRQAAVTLVESEARLNRGGLDYDAVLSRALLTNATDEVEVASRGAGPEQKMAWLRRYRVLAADRVNMAPVVEPLVEAILQCR